MVREGLTQTVAMRKGVEGKRDRFERLKRDKIDGIGWLIECDR